jgi:hydroxymethylbilane synthase
VLAIETRAGDSLAADVAGALDDSETRACTLAERAFLVELAGDCTVPLAAYAERAPDERIRLRALLASAHGDHIVRAEAEVPREHAAQAGSDAAREVLARGGAEILAGLRGAAR